MDHSRIDDKDYMRSISRLTKLVEYNPWRYNMFRINYVEVSVLAIFTSIALFFGTKNIPVSLTLAALSYFTLLAHALKCKSEKSMQEKEMVDHDLWNRIHEIENKLDECCKSDGCCSTVKNCQNK